MALQSISYLLRAHETFFVIKEPWNLAFCFLPIIRTNKVTTHSTYHSGLQQCSAIAAAVFIWKPKFETNLILVGSGHVVNSVLLNLHNYNSAYLRSISWCIWWYDRGSRFQKCVLINMMHLPQTSSTAIQQYPKQAHTMPGSIITWLVVLVTVTMGESMVHI